MFTPHPNPSMSGFGPFFDDHPDAMVIIEPRDQTIVAANRCAESLYGYTAAQMVGSPVDLFKASDTTAPQRVGGWTRSRALDQLCAHKTAAGQLLKVHVSASVVEVEGSTLICSVHRVADEIKGQAVMARQHAEYKLLFDLAPDGLLLTRDKIIINSNDKLLTLLGLRDRSEIVGTRVIDWVATEKDRAICDARHDKLYEAPKVLEPIQYKLLRNDGGTVDVEIQSASITDGDDVLGVAVLRDISERLNLESRLRAAQRLKAVGTLVGGIAHELNNVFQSMFLYSDLIKAELPSQSGVQQNITRLQDSGSRGRDIIQQILTFSSDTPIEMLPQSVHELVREALNYERASITANVTVVDDIRECGQVACDATQIHQLVTNLCRNAWHAMAHSGGTLTVSLHEMCCNQDPAVTTNDTLVLSVSDTGVGIDPEVMPLIFDPFFTTKSQSGGSGLGLSVIHGIVGVIEGEIKIDSTPGEGSTFTVNLPLATTAPGSPVKAVEGVPTPAKLSVLLIDDDETIREACKLVFAQRGIHIDVAVHGKAGLAAFVAAETPYDLVVTDLTMPQLSGVDVAREIRALGSKVPVILSSGHLALDDREAYAKAGVTEFIQKPWRLDELLECVQRHC